MNECTKPRFIAFHPTVTPTGQSPLRTVDSYHCAIVDVVKVMLEAGVNISQSVTKLFVILRLSYPPCTTSKIFGVCSSGACLPKFNLCVLDKTKCDVIITAIRCPEMILLTLKVGGLVQWHCLVQEIQCTSESADQWHECYTTCRLAPSYHQFIEYRMK